MYFSINILRTIVKEKMSALEGTAHSYNHVERVFRIAAFFAKKKPTWNWFRWGLCCMT